MIWVLYKMTYICMCIIGCKKLRKHRWEDGMNVRNENEKWLWNETAKVVIHHEGKNKTYVNSRIGNQMGSLILGSATVTEFSSHQGKSA